MRIDWVTGDGWWRISPFTTHTRPRARNGDNAKHLSQPVTCHPVNAEAEPKPRGPQISEANPVNRDLSQPVAQTNNAPRCGARTRSGTSCRCPAMPNGKCRIHGGLSPGAPRGAANGSYRDGYWTLEAVEERKFIRLLIKGKLGTFHEQI
jgi:hypothetical protein